MHWILFFVCVRASGGGALQVQRHPKVDKLLRPELGEKKGARQVEKLPYMPGLFRVMFVGRVVEDESGLVTLIELC